MIDVVHLNQAGMFAVLPFLTMWAVDVGWAMKVDKMRAAGQDTRDLRVMSAAIHTLGPAVVLGYLSVFSVSGPAGATALLTLAVGMGGTAHSSFWANMVDISPRHCGVVLGASNTIATMPGILANMYV